MPVIRGSALGALNGEPKWVAKIEELMEAVDNIHSSSSSFDRQRFLDASGRCVLNHWSWYCCYWSY